MLVNTVFLNIFRAIICPTQSVYWLQYIFYTSNRYWGYYLVLFSTKDVPIWVHDFSVFSCNFGPTCFLFFCSLGHYKLITWSTDLAHLKIEKPNKNIFIFILRPHLYFCPAHKNFWFFYFVQIKITNFGLQTHRNW